jgi:diadenosine tetraphosphatase ApaH/serine/threonine PP2A family protein phosphatase
VAIISDVHGNRQALEAVMRARRQAGAGALWCLGDVVGYGADPVWCLGTCIGADRCLAGNHDLAAAGKVPLSMFSDWAREALRWTRRALDRSGLAKLERLEPSDPGEDASLFHASPLDPVWEYLVTEEQARAGLEATAAPLVLVGHTHVAAAWRLLPDGRVDGGFIRGERTIALEGARWLVNPGSVGQPRDRDARAAWLLYDPEANTVTFKRTPYDVAGAQNAILQAGLPPPLAARLSSGR